MALKYSKYKSKAMCKQTREGTAAFFFRSEPFCGITRIHVTEKAQEERKSIELYWMNLPELKLVKTFITFSVNKARKSHELTQRKPL